MNEERKLIKFISKVLSISPERAEEIWDDIRSITPGTVYSPAHPHDVAQIAAHSIYRLGYRSVTLKISRHGDPDDNGHYRGHLDIEVIDLDDHDD